MNEKGGRFFSLLPLVKIIPIGKQQKRKYFVTQPQICVYSKFFSMFLLFFLLSLK